MGTSLFIVLDGLDGCGKSLMVTKLHGYLYGKSKKTSILSTREPTYGVHGKHIREILKLDKKPYDQAEHLLSLFLKDRAEHVEKVIQPFLAPFEGDEIRVVLCDRYYYSTIAFQATQGLATDMIVEKNKIFPRPDMAFILDIDPTRALARIENREKEKFEDMAFMEQLRENFLALPDKLDDTLYIIDANQSKEVVFKAIQQKVDTLL